MRLIIFSRLKWQTLWFLWTVVIGAVTTLPWSNYVGHPHWDKVSWIPLYGRPPVVSDIIGNVVLFVPFGLFLAFWLANRPKWQLCLMVLALAGLVSGSAEYFQVFCHNRFPSATDFCANLLGALFGAGFAQLRHRVPAPAERV
jgi:glycopeptide antibiotics resistance protein